ncbi:MAG: hypothetical protein KJ808_01505 [Acidobacteria bacterium]|nr:hypothetical protein [Acidobacteriota bacterium]MBU4307303.1 hypothetical protein [Acidobacteriota bacterium]MBU4405888.1 hypothetical protein [Acidobacteriota bacterium]MCG2811310.1 hypothetical protein [Candidatus Aminicenantes bacterium]
MKKIFVLLLALSLLIVFTKAFGFPLNDEAAACWQKGVQAALLAKDYVPGKFYIKFEQLDSDGKTKDQNEMWLELLPGDKETKLLKTLENGKDITKEALEKEREKKEKDKKKGKKNDGDHTINFSNEEIVPFLTNSKKPVTYRYLGQEKENGVEYNVFEFQKEFIQKKGKKEETIKHKGKIWLDVVSGMPVKSSYTYDPLPSMTKQMEMNTTFISVGDKFFIKDHKMYIKAGFLFIKKRFRISFVLDGYRKSDKENPGH